MKKTLLIVACLLISVGLYDKYSHSQKIDVIPDSVPVIPEPPKPIPVLKSNIIHDDLELAEKLTVQHNKQLIIIFGADWCPYCHKLKNDLNMFDTSKFILCIIDIDKNKDLAAKHKLKILPTSILLDNANNETSRKTGYIHSEYKMWLDSH